MCVWLYKKFPLMPFILQCISHRFRRCSHCSNELKIGLGGFELRMRKRQRERERLGELLCVCLGKTIFHTSQGQNLCNMRNILIKFIVYNIILEFSATANKPFSTHTLGLSLSRSLSVSLRKTGKPSSLPIQNVDREGE